MAKHRKIKTVWNVRTYDVWGNAKDGYEVNDSFNRGEIELLLEVEVNNVGTPQEFQSAYPTDKQIRSVFGVRCQLQLDGDDLTIYVNRERDSYPIGEMFCTSHESLSAIREKDLSKQFAANVVAAIEGRIQ